MLFIFSSRLQNGRKIAIRKQRALALHTHTHTRMRWEKEYLPTTTYDKLKIMIVNVFGVIGYGLWSVTSKAMQHIHVAYNMASWSTSDKLNTREIFKHSNIHLYYLLYLLIKSYTHTPYNELLCLSDA